MQVGEKTKGISDFGISSVSGILNRNPHLHNLSVMIYDVRQGVLVEPRNCEWESDLSVIV